MLRRWIIRALFSLPDLVCMAGWFWSTSHSFYAYRRHGHSSINFGTEWGAIFFNFSHDNLPEPDGWTCGAALLKRSWQLPQPVDCHYFLGFSFGWFPTFRGGNVPYWFLILAFAALFCFAWRKTAARPNPTGFPIEPQN
jgi:hypothetical protein